jgi:hypothetical protein
MAKSMKLPRILACALATALAACGGGSDGPPPASTNTPAVPAPTPVTPRSNPGTSIEPSAATVHTGERVAFSVKGPTAGGASTTSWSVSGPGCAGISCGTIDSSGVFVAPVTIPRPSNITVTATSGDGSILLGQASILWVPSEGSYFAQTGSMRIARLGHTATLMHDGRVLITGGTSTESSDFDVGDLNSAEVYDPSTGAFSPTGSMRHFRARHTATLLADGQVLITGPAGEASAELYDPVTGQFSLTGSLRTIQRLSQTAAPLPGGKVLIAGEAGAEIYDPVTGSFSSAAAYPVTIDWIAHAVPLGDGRVLLMGSNPSLVFDPTRNSFDVSAWLLSSYGTYVGLATATLLTDGRVLIAGGTDDMFFQFSEAQHYDPATETFRFTGGLSISRAAHAAVRLADGRVLVLGGDNMPCDIGCEGSDASAELYDPDAGIFIPAPSMGVSRTSPQATLLLDGNVLVTGGVRYCGIGCYWTTESAEIFHVDD